MPVQAKTVKELREKTGLPMMECKRALEETDGDVDKAIEELRKSGAKSVEKLQGRKADQGRVVSYISEDGKVGALISLRCETESVATNSDFCAFSQQLCDVLVKNNPADRDALLGASLDGGGTVNEGITDLVNRLRENITLGQFARFEADAVTQYIHFDNHHAGMVALSGGSTSDDTVSTIGKDICMHVVFAKPEYLSRDRFDENTIAKEREIRLAAAQNDPKNAKKPPEIMAKIVDGQINKFIAERCLLEQEFIKDDQKRSVEKSIEASGAGVTVSDFAYIATDSE